MRHFFGLLVVLSLLAVSYSVRRFPVPRHFSTESSPFTTNYTQVYIDQFDWSHLQKFQLKYLCNSSYYKDGGPLFFYTGNEGTIEGFAQNTGIMLDIAPQFNALVVFAEHRYYGDNSSNPYGDKSFYNVTTASYLSIEQVLRDYVQVIQNIRSTYPKLGKVIGFGGSYGGMLSAWARLLYSHVFDGAWAASAPIAYFRGSGVKLGDYHKVITESLERFGCKRDSIIEGFHALDTWSTSYKQLQILNTAFNTDQKSPINTKDDINQLKEFIRDTFEAMSMANYPYSANFLRPVGAWPLAKACAGLNNTHQTPLKAVQALKGALDAYYGENYKTCFSDQCGDPAYQNLGSLLGWNWQSCTEIAIDICAQGAPNDVFWADCFEQKTDTVPNFETYLKTSCRSLSQQIPGYLNSMLQFDAVKTFFGFDLKGASNIILTNGKLDPWSAGAVRVGSDSELRNNIFHYSIDGAAHHLDLRQPNSCDPPSVVNARFQVVNILKCWLNQNDENDDCSPSNLQWPLPSWEVPTNPPTECHDLVNQYPWGQQKEVGSSIPPETSSTLVTPASTTKGLANVVPTVSLVFGLFLISFAHFVCF